MAVMSGRRWRLGVAAFVLGIAGFPGAAVRGEDDLPDPAQDPVALLRRLGRAERRAQAAWDAGRSEEAVALLLRAVDLVAAAPGPQDPGLLPFLEGWGGRLADAGRYGPAGDLFAQALAIREALSVGGPRGVAGALARLAGVRQAAGRYAEAEALYLRGLSIVERASGPDHPDTAVTLQGLAQVHVLQGRYAIAQPLLERALAIDERSLPADHANTAAALSDLASVLNALGQRGPMLRLLERAFALAETRYGPESPQLLPFLDNLAFARAAVGRGAEAEALRRRALALAERTLGPEHVETASVLDSLGGLLMDLGRPAEAEPLQERALRAYASSLGPDHPAVAGALRSLAGLCMARGDAAGAIPLLERALLILRDALGPDHPRAAFAAQGLGEAIAAAGDPAKAAPLHREALAGLSRWVRRSAATLTADQRRDLLGVVRGPLDRWVAFAPRVGLTGYEEVLTAKGIVAREEAAQREALRRGGAEARRGLEDLAAAERRLAAVVSRRPSRRDPARTAAWQKEYATASAEAEVLARGLGERHPELRRPRDGGGPALADVQRSLGPGEVFVDVLRTVGGYVAFVVRSEGEPVRVDLRPADVVDQAAGRWLEVARAETAQAAERTAAGAGLRDLVWRPIAAHLGDGVRTVLLSPDAALAAVPFAALPEGEGPRTISDGVRLVHVASAADLLPRRGEATRGTGALVVGDVDFDASEAAPAGAATEGPRTAADQPPRTSRFAHLPGTAEEAAAVAARLGEGTAVLRRAGATEARLRDRVRGRRFLHIATHGFARLHEDLTSALAPTRGQDRWLGGALERQLVRPDPMLLAGVALAGANLPASPDGVDGVLSALEASWLDLGGADLVVLSACETAAGAAASGEGVLGLATGFQMAGARHVVASLWKVDDDATSLLMERFYDLLLDPASPRAPPDALREASIWLRDARPEGRDRSAPRFWAAFVCYERR